MNHLLSTLSAELLTATHPAKLKCSVLFSSFYNMTLVYPTYTIYDFSHRLYKLRNYTIYALAMISLNSYY